MRKKYMNICLILGLLCLVYGLIVAIAGSGGTKFFIVWIGIAVILFALQVCFIWEFGTGYRRSLGGYLEYCAVYFSCRFL